MTRKEMAFIVDTERKKFETMVGMQNTFGSNSPEANRARASWCAWYEMKEKFVLKHDTEI